MSKIELSILMTAYNSEAFIKEAIQSLLNQTFTNFELVIINDHSTDSTAEIIKSFNDERIITVLNSENKGIVFSRARALSLAKGEFFAFFDSDDMAHPQKFQKQIDFLKQNIEYGFIGTSTVLIDKNGVETERWKINAPYRKILPRMVFHNYFVNSSVVFRSELIKDFVFPENHDIVEDYVLWWWLIRKTKAKNLPEYLTYYRQHDKSIIHRNTELKSRYENKIYSIILNDIGIEPNEENLKIHISIKDKSLIYSSKQQKEFRKWILEILIHLKTLPEFDATPTISFILNRWFKVCYKSRGNPFLFLNGIFNFGFYFSIFTIYFQWKNK